MNKLLIVYTDSVVKTGEIYLPGYTNGDVVAVKRHLSYCNKEDHFLTVNNNIDIGHIKKFKKESCECMVSTHTAHVLGLDTGGDNSEFDFILVSEPIPETDNDGG